MLTEPALLDSARLLAPVLADRAREGERLRTMPDDLVARIRTAGLFGLALPRSLGGAELPPMEIVEIIEEVSRADGSAGWTTLIGNATAYLAWLEPGVAESLLAGATDQVGAAVFAPTGKLTPAGERFRLDGRWAYASGVGHADWYLGGAFVWNGDGPRMVPGRGPDWRLAVTSTADLGVVDTWDAVGLRGTGSHDVVATGLDVPAEHLIAPFHEPARHPGPLWRFPFFTLVGVTMIGFPLGVGRRALDELAAAAVTKVRQPAQHPIGHDGDVQVALAAAEGGLQAARALAVDALGSMWDTAQAGDVPCDAERARFLLATQQAMAAARAAVDTAVELAGMAALHADHPLQRCLRDIHAADRHTFFSQAAKKRAAAARLGLPHDTFWY